MEQQIQSILSQETTKTRKIQQLLLLGLTRRQVADLVANGNYGFVYNVYKKMQGSAVTTASAPIISTSAFTRKFGVEIEAYNASSTAVLRAVRRQFIDCFSESYNHTTRPHWKIVSDSSISGQNPFELVSPILEGEEGLKEVKKVCKALKEVNAKVNSSCGLHVHINASDFTITTWKHLLVNYARLEKIIDRFMPQSRRDNRYCRGFSEIRDFENRIMAAESVDDIRSILQTRYRKINADAYVRHGSIEFRQHGGTTDFEKIHYWVRFLESLVKYSESAGLFDGTTVNDLAGILGEDTFTYIKYRTLKFKNEENEH